MELVDTKVVITSTYPASLKRVAVLETYTLGWNENMVGRWEPVYCNSWSAPCLSAKLRHFLGVSTPYCYPVYDPHFLSSKGKEPHFDYREPTRESYPMMDEVDGFEEKNHEAN